MTDTFPQGLATLTAFCNREVERQQIKDIVKSGGHLYLYSPRRYGKTSLVHKVISESHYAHCEVDLLLSHTLDMAVTELLAGISTIISNTLSIRQRTLATISEYLGRVQPEVVLTESGPQITFNQTPKHESTLKEAFLGLDRLLSAKKKRCLFFIDEFQQLSDIDHGETLEATIRHVAQKTTALSFIFSGSNRRLLRHMFEDSARPLFHLCQKITLERITEKHYIPFIQAAATSRWKRGLQTDRIRHILTITERHAYYVNLLCSRLWQLTRAPSIDKINDTWTQILVEEKTRFTWELQQLSTNQKIVVYHRAKYPALSPTGIETASQLKLNPSSIAQSLNELKKKDYLDNDGTLIDPALRAFLARDGKLQ